MVTTCIGEILKEMDIIAEEQIEAALHVQVATDDALGEILVDLNFITTDELATAIAFQNELEYIDLDNYVPIPEVLKLLDKEFAMLHMLIPLKIQDDKLIVATSWPNKEETNIELQKRTNHQIEFVISDSTTIGKYVQFYYEQLDNSVENQINDMIKLSVVEEKVDVISFIDLIINNAIKDRVSDIHITPEKFTSHIFFRIDGVLKHYYSIPESLHDQFIVRIKVLSKLDIAQHLLPQDGDFSYEFLQENYNIRVSSIPTLNGEKIALRLMPENFKLYSLEHLGFEDELVERISKDLHKPSGIIVVIGASGSGKTTTMYAMLRKIDVLRRNVISVEDPVEYRLPFVNQIQINTSTKYTFDKALHHIARQDPDVIAIGEILDEETAKLAIRSSATGHLILSTLSGSSAVTTISRLKDLGVDKYMLSDGLLSIVSQKLLRRLCNECKEEVELSKDELIQSFTESKETIISLEDEKIKIYKAVGCKHCRDSGYAGRISIVEFFQVDDNIREMIERDKSSTEIQHYIRSVGYKDMKADALQKVLKGVSSLEEVKRII
ncbi:MAG: ATPase, T2SS/T4P/T4SS family [Campylobacterota bacterium]|nr:ATPase, T2SS/T4P/T4SS family [Campylobacterota bacterium]